jgi:hypothetical protein
MNAQELAAKFAAKIAEVAVEKDRQTVREPIGASFESSPGLQAGCRIGT